MTTRRSILKRLAGAVAVAFTGIVGAVERAKGEPLRPGLMRYTPSEGRRPNADDLARAKVAFAPRLVRIENVGNPFHYFIKPGERLSLHVMGDDMAEVKVTSADGVTTVLHRGKMPPCGWPRMSWLWREGDPISVRDFM